MRKQGLSLIQNTYIGFDTEFNNNEIGSNSLVSAQLAICSKVYLKFPKTPRYTFYNLDVDKNIIHRKKTTSKFFIYSKVETSIQ